MRPEDKDGVYWTLIFFFLWLWTFLPAIAFYEHLSGRTDSDSEWSNLQAIFSRRRVRHCTALGMCNCVLLVAVYWTIYATFTPVAFPEGLEMALVFLWAFEMLVAVVCFYNVEQQRRRKTADALASEKAAEEEMNV